MVERTPFQPVEDWLRNLGLLHYAQSFYDNGYEDIDTCKLIKDSDLDVINVKSERDRNDILSAVANLNKNLYFELEQEAPAVERVKLEKVLLKSKLKECLNMHNIQLTEPPYFNPDGTLGDLYTLAIRLADELETYFEDVLEALEVLRKRQLPVQSYNQMNEIPVSKVDIPLINDPAEYLDVETRKKSRTLSTSKYDTRITKSTTDLSLDLFRNTATPSNKLKPEKPASKQRSFINIFKRHKDEVKGKVDQRKSAYDFNATDVTLSQTEIKNLFEKVKSKQISQEDALATVQKRGLSKSLSGDGNEHSIHIDSSPPSDTVSLNKFKKGKSSKSMKKPSSLFYADDVSNSELLLVKLQERRASVAGDMACSAKTSPDLSKPSLLKIIRGSLRKKTKSSDGSSFDKDEQLSLSEINDLPPDGFLNTEEVSNLQPQYVDLQTVQQNAEVAKKEFRIAPPPPPRLDLKRNANSSPTISSSQDVGDNPREQNEAEPPSLKERHPSLKIKSYTKYQEEISKRKLTENKEETLASSRSQNDSQIQNIPVSSTLIVTKPPSAPPRPIRRIQSLSETNPVAPPRRQKPTNATSPLNEDKNFDDIGKEMSRLIDDLNDDLTYLDNNSQRTSKADESKPPQKPVILPRQRFPSNIQNNITSSNNPDVQNEQNIKSTSQNLRGTLVDSSSVKSLEKGDNIKKIDHNLKSSDKEGEIVEQKKLSVRPSLNQILKKKLRKEEIKLYESPYSSSDGSWTVPYALVKRYSDELQHPANDIAVLFEAIRTEKRIEKKLPVVPLDISRLRNDGSLPKKVSLQDWLVHIGLPMFIGDLSDAGIDSIFDISEMSIEELKQVSVCDEKHMALLIKEAKNHIKVLN